MRIALRDARLKRPEFRGELERRAREAGWAEVGGSIIRKSQDYDSPDFAIIVGRTVWIPFAEWYQRMQQDPKANMPDGRSGVAKAVKLALCGWRMTPQQRRTVKWMMDDYESYAAWREQEERDAAEQFAEE